MQRPLTPRAATQFRGLYAMSAVTPTTKTKPAAIDSLNRIASRAPAGLRKILRISR